MRRSGSSNSHISIMAEFLEAALIFSGVFFLLDIKTTSSVFHLSNFLPFNVYVTTPTGCTQAFRWQA